MKMQTTVENSTVRLPQLGAVSIRKTDGVIAVELDALQGQAAALKPGDAQCGNNDHFLNLSEAKGWANKLKEDNTVANLPWYSAIFRPGAALRKKDAEIDAALKAVELLLDRANRALAGQKLTPAERGAIANPLRAELAAAAQLIEKLPGDADARYSREARWEPTGGGTRYDVPSDAGVSVRGDSSPVYSSTHQVLARVAQALWDKGALYEGHNAQAVANAFKAAGKKIEEVGFANNPDTVFFTEVVGMSKRGALGYLSKVSDILNAWTSAQ